MPGMSLSAFTIFHTILSLIGIASGFVVLFGMLGGKRLDGWTALFLAGRKFYPERAGLAAAG